MKTPNDFVRSMAVEVLSFLVYFIVIFFPFQTLANMSNGIPEQLRQTFGMVIDAAIKQNHATLFHKLKVREIIWGYNDTLLYELKKALPQFEPIFKKYNISFPDINPFVQLQVSSLILQYLCKLNWLSSTVCLVMS